MNFAIMNWGDNYPPPQVTGDPTQYGAPQMPPAFGYDIQAAMQLQQPYGYPGFIGAPGQGMEMPRVSGACFCCGEMGHISRNCPNSSAQNNQARFRGACHRCGEEGHYAKDCPSSPFNMGGEPLIFDIDTGDVGRIIGRGGSKIRDLEEETGCRIKILRDNRPPQVNLYGSPEQCQRARVLIEELLQERRGGNMYR